VRAKTPLAKVFFLPDNGARKIDVFCWRLVDVGASSYSSFPGNGARKMLDCFGGDDENDRSVGNPKRKV
jgi:hypothetical protein